eukprot:3691265-Amphidinium_carterae.2
MPTSSNLTQSPSLTILSGGGTSLAPRHKASSGGPPGLPRVPARSLSELGKCAQGPTTFRESMGPHRRRGGPKFNTSPLDPAIPSADEAHVSHNLRILGGRACQGKFDLSRTSFARPLPKRGPTSAAKLVYQSAGKFSLTSAPYIP